MLTNAHISKELMLLHQRELRATSQPRRAPVRRARSRRGVTTHLRALVRPPAVHRGAPAGGECR